LLVLAAAHGSTADVFGRGLTWARPAARFTLATIFRMSLACQIQAVQGELCRAAGRQDKNEGPVGGANPSMTDRFPELPSDRRGHART